MADHWTVVTLAFDVAVIIVNVVELLILLGKWKSLDRVEHLLLSLCLSDLLAGGTMLAQDYLQLCLQVDSDVKITDVSMVMLECFFVMSVFASNFHVLIIAVERLTAVAWPMKYDCFTTIKCKICSLVWIWLGAVLLSTGLVFLIRLSPRGGRTGYYVYASTLMFACVSVFCIYTVLASTLLIRNYTLRVLLPSQKVNERHATLFCLLIGISFVVCYLPISLGHLWSGLSHEVSTLLMTLNHFTNPFIYFAKQFFSLRRRSYLEKRSRQLSRERLFSSRCASQVMFAHSQCAITAL